MPPTCVVCWELPRCRRPNICDLMVPAIGWTCVWRVKESVMVLLGARSSCSVISVKARAVLPYDSNAHPRILLSVFLSTVFSLVDTVPYRKIRIMQGRDNDKASPPWKRRTRPSAKRAAENKTPRERQG